MKYEFIFALVEKNFKIIYMILGGKKEDIDKIFTGYNRNSLQGKNFIASCSKSVFLFYSPVTFIFGLLLWIFLGLLGFETLGFYLYWFCVIYPLSMVVVSYAKEYKTSHSIEKSISIEEVKYTHDMVNMDLVVTLIFSMIVLLTLRAP